MKLILVLIALFVFQPTFPAYAHVLKKDGPIGVVLHINPEDDPYVGQPADFFFDIKDTSNKFDASRCNCVAKILKNNQEIYSQSLDSSVTFVYSFPEKAIYQVILKGQPSEGSPFQPFEIKYDIRVSREQKNSSQNFLEHYPHLAGFGAGFIVLAIFIAIDRFRKIGSNKTDKS